MSEFDLEYTALVDVRGVVLYLGAIQYFPHYRDHQFDQLSLDKTTADNNCVLKGG